MTVGRRNNIAIIAATFSFVKFNKKKKRRRRRRRRSIPLFKSGQTPPGGVTDWFFWSE